MEVGGGYRAREGCNRFSATELRIRLGRLVFRSRMKGVDPPSVYLLPCGERLLG